MQKGFFIILWWMCEGFVITSFKLVRSAAACVFVDS